MKIKLRFLFGIGVFLFLLPIIYVPTTFIKGVLIMCGLLVVYFSWRLQKLFTLLLSQQKTFENKPLSQ